MARRRSHGLRGTDPEHRSEVNRVLGLFNNKARDVEGALTKHDCFGAVAGMLHLYALEARLETNYGDVKRHTPDLKHKMARARETQERLFTRASYCIKREW